MTTEPLPTPPAKSSKRLILILSIAGGVLLLVVIALVFLLLGRSLGEGEVVASTSPTPTESASASPTPAPSETQAAPVDNSVRFTSFAAPTTVMCDAGDEDNQPPKPEIQVSWASANAVEAWYSPSNEDAKDDGYMKVPLSGNQNNLTDEHLFPCFHDETADYTITLVGANGQHVSKHWTVTNVGDR